MRCRFLSRIRCSLRVTRRCETSGRLVGKGNQLAALIHRESK
jgi:hypothetical protein